MERLTFSPCDECNYSYTKNNQISNVCKICEFKNYIDLEEQGLLLQLPTEYVYCLVDVNTKWGGMVMSKSIKNLTLYEIEQIDKRKYYSTKEAAEAALKEMEK